MKKCLEINGRYIGHIPTQWDDLSCDQIKDVCKLSLGSASTEYLKVQFLLRTTNLSLLNKDPIHVLNDVDDYLVFSLWSKITGRIWLDSRDIDKICKNFDFLFTHVQDKNYIESSLIENKFPFLKTRFGRKLYGPDSALYNISLAEFIRLETLYEQINKQPSRINHFIACLYRPRDKSQNPNNPSFSGDMRQPFNDHLVAYHARYCRFLSPWQKMYIRMFYDGCRKFIIHKHPMAFSSSDNSSDDSLFESFNKLVNVLCLGDASKSEQIRRTLLWDVLPELEKISLQEKSLRNSLKKS